jgi:hypothetical protein
MTVAGVMMGLAIKTIHLLLGAEHEATKSVRYTASVARLARAFREDIHAARAVELPAVEPGKATLTASTTGGQIRYELESHVATRVETPDTGDASYDKYYFPPGSRLRFEQEGELLRLTVEMPLCPPAARTADAEAPSPAMRTLTIEAAPSRIRRLEPKT